MATINEIMGQLFYEKTNDTEPLPTSTDLFVDQNVGAQIVDSELDKEAEYFAGQLEKIAGGNVVDINSTSNEDIMKGLVDQGAFVGDVYQNLPYMPKQQKTAEDIYNEMWEFGALYKQASASGDEELAEEALYNALYLRGVLDEMQQ